VPLPENEEIAFVPGHGWVHFKDPNIAPEVAPASSRDVQKELMGSWLEHLVPWDVFFTGTWSSRVTVDGVLYGTKNFLRRVEQWAGVSVYAFFGVERGDKGDLLHVHALIGNVAHLTPFCGKRLSPGKRGLNCCLLHAWPWGYARAYPYDPALGAAHYVCKYVVKDLAEYELIGFPASPQRAFPMGKKRR
jgi:hypothetical protein